MEAVVVSRKVSCGGGVTYHRINQILAFFVCPFSATWERLTIITDMQEHLAKRNACQTRQIGKGYKMGDVFYFTLGRPLLQPL